MKKGLLFVLLLSTALSLAALPLLRLRGRVIRSPFAGDGVWLQFDPDPEEDDEHTENVVYPKLDRIRHMWAADLPEAADGSPVYVSDVTVAGGTQHDLVIITTMQGRLMAFDSLTGANIWSTTPPAGPRWTTSSPAVSPDRDIVYSYGLDGYVHAYRINDGAELTTNGFPQLVTLKGDVEKASSALSIVTARNGHSYLYATVAGYPEPGDDGDYQGHLVAIDLNTGKQNVFNAACSDRAIHFVENGNASNDCAHVQSGIWARAPVAYDAATDRIFVTTSNGDYDADQGGFNWGDTIVALHPDGSTDAGTPIDSYTPAEYQFLQIHDLDFGSTSPVTLPLARGTHLPRIAVQSGKDSVLRLIDVHDLSGQGGPRHVGGELYKTQVPQGGVVLTRPAVWLSPGGTTWVFVTTHHGASGLELVIDDDGKPSLETRWVNDVEGATPVMVNGVLYFARNHELVALDPKTGERLYSSDSIGSIHWQSPIIVNGRIYVCDNERRLHAYDAR
ncbi:MAG TPA: PQQ-binding-like beta-propeller repeat protein [Thermoanaerobaculia bacterium]